MHNVKAVLGAQYVAYPFYTDYYKRSIMNGNINILEIEKSMELCPELKIAVQREYKKISGFSEGSNIDMLVTTTPFAVVKGTGRVMGVYNPSREGTMNLTDVTVDKNNVCIKMHNREVQEVTERYIPKRDYWFVPLASIYTACEVLTSLCNEFNRNGVGIEANGKRYVVTKITSSLRDLVVGKLICQTKSDGEVIVYVLDISKVKRL